ncbi:hypothetical protein PMAYCL1PPCAC_15519, partial [Pristionchus mayeri]
PHFTSCQIAMVRALLISFFFLSLILASSAYRLAKRDFEPIERYCKLDFLEKSSKVLESIDSRTVCNQQLPLAKWYGPIRTTIDDFKAFCCKAGCNTGHFIDFTCTTMWKS